MDANEQVTNHVNTSAGLYNAPVLPAPCPGCGRCPTCGRGGYSAPYWYVPFNGPYWHSSAGNVSIPLQASSIQQ